MSRDGRANLIPIRSKAEAKRLGAKGGSVKSPRKKWASQLREWKKKADIGQADYKKLVSIMEEPESSILHILKYLEETKKHTKNATQMSYVAKALIDLHKAHHGEKIKTENVHHVVHWDNVIGDILGTGHDKTEKSD